MGVLERLPSIIASLHILLPYWPLFILSACICRFIYNRYSYGIHQIPGPFLQSGTQLPRFLQVWYGHTQVRDEYLHRRYGKIVRIGPKLVSVSDPTKINQIYGINSKFYKSSFYDPSTAYDQDGIIPDPFILKDRALHARMKRNAANAYSLSALVQLEPYIDETILLLFKKLDLEAQEPDHVVDLGHWFLFFAMDAIFNISFGKTLNFLETGDDQHILAALSKLIAYSGTIGQIPSLHKFLLGNPVVNKLWLGEMGFETGLMSLASQQVSQFKQKLQEKPDDGPRTFTERLLLNQLTNPQSITDREINVHAFGNITAGSDTTAIALRAIFYYLLKNPRTYAKLCAEVQTGTDTLLSWSEASKYQYLEAVVKEAMRLHPSMAIMLGRTVPEGGAQVGEYFLPKGTEVGISAWVLHRDPNVYPNPDLFQPERWLTSNAEDLAVMNRSFFTFGAGTHTCSGKHISLMEITKLVPNLLRRYDIELVDPKKEWRFTNRMFTPQEGLLVKVRKRI